MIEMGWRRYDFAGVLVSHFCCPCFQNHSALTPPFFRTARANKRPCERIKRRGGTERVTGKRGCQCAQLRRDCRHRMQLFRNGDLVTGRGSPRVRNSLARHCRTAGPDMAKFCFRLIYPKGWRLYVICHVLLYSERLVLVLTYFLFRLIHNRKFGQRSRERNMLLIFLKCSETHASYFFYLQFSFAKIVNLEQNWAICYH